jgi:hypothetical protein
MLTPHVVELGLRHAMRVDAHERDYFLASNVGGSGVVDRPKPRSEPAVRTGRQVASATGREQESRVHAAG